MAESPKDVVAKAQSGRASRLDAAEAAALNPKPSAPAAPATSPPPTPSAPDSPSLVSRVKKFVGLADGGEVDEPQPEQMTYGGMDNFRKGGPVTKGTTGMADDVPAMLSKGEYVLPADTTQAVGVDKLDHLRESTHNPANRAGSSHAQGSRTMKGLK